MNEKRIYCDICKKEIKKRADILIFTKQFNPFKFIPLHKKCYESEERKAITLRQKGNFKESRNSYYSQLKRFRGSQWVNVRSSDYFPILSYNFNLRMILFFIIFGLALFYFNFNKFIFVIFLAGLFIFAYVVLFTYFKYLRYLPRI
jgi:hypothetical protein